MAKVDRRKAVRIPAKLAMEIRISDVDTAKVESINVSANGVYFISDKYIPELTKLDITLELPAKKGQRARGRNVVCSGVVVRTEPPEQLSGVDEYEIACYFTSIDPADRETLETYILKQVAF
jgi:c-di-GMP-binding flagellar brake protein YcgR